MDMFIAVGAGVVLYQYTMDRHRKLNSPTPPNKFAALRVGDSSYTPLGVNNINHPEANQVSHETKFSRRFARTYERRQRIKRRQTPQTLNANITKVAGRIRPVSSSFIHDPITLGQYTEPDEMWLGRTVLSDGINVPYANHLV